MIMPLREKRKPRTSKG